MMRTLCLLVVFLGLTGCSPGHVNPPLYTCDTDQLAKQSAQLEAIDSIGVIYQITNTHSMEPLLMGGDYVVVKYGPFPDDPSVLVGHVLAYRAAWQTAGAPAVIHRCISVDSKGMIMRGDNNSSSFEDAYRVSKDNYIGELIAIYRVKLL